MLRNIFSNWFGLVVLGIVGAILTPMMIHGLGNFYYGMWILVGSVADYYGLFDMGMRWTLFRFVAHLKGANERRSLSAVFTTGLAISMVLAGLLVVVTIVLSFALPRLFAFSNAARSTFGYIVLLMGISVAISLPGQFLSAYLRGLQRFDLYNVGLIVLSITRGGTLMILMKLHRGIVPVCYAYVVAGVGFVIVHWILVRYADRELEVHAKFLSWKRTRELLNYSFYSFVSNAGEVLRFYTDSFVIGKVLDIALITPFSVATRLIDYFKSIMSGVNGPMMTQLSELDGQNKPERLRQAFLRATRLTLLLSVFIGLMLILDGRMLIQLWIGPSVSMSYPILVVLTIGYIVGFGQQPCLLIIFARARHHRSLSWWTLVEGGCNLLLSIYWAHKYMQQFGVLGGLLGVALGTTVPQLFSKLIVQPFYALRDLSMSAWDYFREGLGRPFAVGCVFFSLCWMLMNRFAAPSFLRFMITVSWQTVLFGILSYLVGMANTEREFVRERGKRFAVSFGLARS